MQKQNGEQRRQQRRSLRRREEIPCVWTWRHHKFSIPRMSKLRRQSKPHSGTVDPGYRYRYKIPAVPRSLGRKRHASDHIRMGIMMYRYLYSSEPSSGRIWPADCASLNSSRTSPVLPTAFRKSSRYAELNPTTSGSKLYGVSMTSSDSPASVEEEEIFSSFCSRRILIAPERSSANCATRWIELVRSSLRTTTNLLLSRGITAS